MFRFGFLASFAAVLSVVLRTAAAVPVAVPFRQETLPIDEHACERIDKYTTKWFLDNVRPEFNTRLVNRTLFYSRGMSGPARDLAWDRGLLTIWDIWPCYLYVHHDTPNNPMRCIHHDERQRIIFYENMSRAFAAKASQSAIVMHSFQDYDNPPQTGIWGRIEFPTLQAVTDVDWVAKLNPDATSARVFWKRLRESFTQGLAWWTQSDRDRNGNSDLRKRGSAACMMPEEYSFYDNMDW